MMKNIRNFFIAKAVLKENKQRRKDNLAEQKQKFTGKTNKRIGQTTYSPLNPKYSTNRYY